MSTAVIACGALAVHVRAIAARRRWDVEVLPVDALLHNRPERIPAAAREIASRHERVVLAYADCGTYGALDELALPRLRGDHCYDVFAAADVQAALQDEPGTYFLTDFLARTFEHTVWRELGLDRWPELRDAYFGSYRRVVWLAQRRTPAGERAAARAAELLRLSLEIREVGDAGLERELEALLVSEEGPTWRQGGVTATPIQCRTPALSRPSAAPATPRPARSSSAAHA